MKKFEYYTTRKLEDNFLGYSVEEEYLNSRGDINGLELISVIKDAGTVIYYWKREIPQPELTKPA